MQDLQKLLEEEKAKAAAAKAEREAQLQMLLERPTTIDTRATAGLLDSVFGTSTMAGAKAAAEQAAGEQDLLQQLLKEEREPGESGTSGVKALMAQQSQQGKQESIDFRHDKSRLDKFQNDVDTQFTKQVINPVQELQQQFSAMESALANGDTQQIRMILGIFARGISGEKGVLTDQDIKRVFPETFKGRVSQMKAYLTGQEDADPVIVEKAADLLEVAKEAAAKRYSTLAKQKAEAQARKSVAKLPGAIEYVNDYKDQAEDIISSFAPVKKKEETSAGAGASAGLPSRTEAASKREKLLQALRGNK